MLRLLTFLVIAAAVALLATWFANNPGNVVIAWRGQTLETSVGILLLAFLAAGVALTVLFELLRLLGGLPARMRRGQRLARERRGYQALTTGFIAAAAGNVNAARISHREAQRLLPNQSPVLLLAAQTAQLEGREEIAHLKFQQMLRSPDTELLGLRGLLAQAAKGGDSEEALALARRAYKRSPTTPWVLTTLFDLLTRGEQWEPARRLVDELLAQKLITETQANRRRGVLQHLLAGIARGKHELPQAFGHAKRAVRLAPGFAPAAVLAAEMALLERRRRPAQKIIEECWKIAPHPELARVYGQLVPSETAEQRLQRVEKGLKPIHPDHVELHIALAELALAAERPDRARSELERALALDPTQRVFRLMAELDRGAGDPAKAEAWLARAAEAKPDPAWVCADTGEAFPDWRPFGASGRFDALEWATPPKFAALIGREHGPYLTAETEAAQANEPEAQPATVAPAQTAPAA